MQAKIEEYDKDKENFLLNAKNLFKEAKTDNAKLIDLIRQKDAEVLTGDKISKQKDESIKSYQERLLSIPILEHKLNGLRESHEKEKEQVKQYYKQEFANLTKEVQHIHKVLTVNLSLDERIKLFEKELFTYKEFSVKKIQVLQDKMNHLEEFENKLEEAEQEAQTILQGEEYNILRRKSSVRSVAPPPTKEFNKPQRARPITAYRNSSDPVTRSIEDKTFGMKQRLNKKKSDLINELSVLSVSRIKDLNKELTNSNQETFFSKSPKVFDGYFGYLQSTLDKISEVNEKEKSYLRNFSHIYDTARRLDSAINSPKIPGSMAGSMTGSRLDIDNEKGKSHITQSARRVISKTSPNGTKSSFFGKFQG